MAVIAAPQAARTTTQPGPRRYVMCEPRSFAVVYRINPWMDPRVPVDRTLALRQWNRLRETLTELGHHVELVEPVAGLPDMVFAANASLVVGDRVLAARMHHRERQGEEEPFRSWFAARGFSNIRVPSGTAEGEGDFTIARGVLLAGWGFRTDRRVHDEASMFLDLPVLSLRMVDPRWYHLDLGLFALDDQNIAYCPDAFDRHSRARLRRWFPDALIVSRADALRFGCNALSDGTHVLVPAGAQRLPAQLRERGYEPIAVDCSELEKAGGSVKCCVLQLRDAEEAAHARAS